MRGKYSPTVTAAYMQDQEWWHKYACCNHLTWNQYDPDGYDSYGYNSDDIDRAGNHENVYAHNDALDANWDTEDDYNWRYDEALNTWGFDGVKPVVKI